MELILHPEYYSYLQHLELDRRCRRALADWKSSNSELRVEEDSRSWAYAQAQDFTWALSDFLKAYNQVLFDQFPHCRDCRGQCCMVSGAYVAVFDCLALGLLECPYPRLPEHIEAGERDCIYRGVQGCLWPQTWRTFKCWLFYCPGGSTGKAFNLTGLVQALRPIMDECLPQPLKRYQSISGIDLASHLDNPLVFSEAIGGALDRILVRPLDAIYPFLADELGSSYYRNTEAPQETFFCTDAEWSSFIQEVSRHLDELQNDSSSLSVAQCLADLEMLEWIRLGRPGNAAFLLSEMYTRYARAPETAGGCDAWVITTLRGHLLRFMESIHVPPPLF